MPESPWRHHHAEAHRLLDDLRLTLESDVPTIDALRLLEQINAELRAAWRARMLERIERVSEEARRV